MKKVYIVETASGSTDDDNAMLFDSVWTNEDLARDYCKKFHRNPSVWHSEDWPYTITETELNTGN
jgi:hypothetical protein